MNQMVSTDFIKMDGAENDFVIIDAREKDLSLDEWAIRKLTARDNPVTKGCDQLVLLQDSYVADCKMEIYNSDAGRVDACGNATRCVAFLEMQRLKKQTVTIETRAGILRAANAGMVNVQVDMGEAKLGWEEIPLSKQMDTLHLKIENGALKDPVGVSMGNPHAVFFVPDVNTVPLAELGPALEHHSLFPERANIGVAQILSSDTIRLRVFERGVGETRACGTGACAAVVAASRRGLIAGRQASVFLPGGTIEVDWLKNGRVLMTGPVNMQFEGTVEL